MSVSFDRAAGYYDATRPLPTAVAEQIANAIVALSAATPNTRFLEPGAGTGRIAMPLVERGYSYTGVDISQEMLDVFRRKVEGRTHRLELLEADVTALPFAPASFDVALVTHVLHLVPDWQRGLEEIRRVLTPDGVFLYCQEKGWRRPAQEEFERRWQEILAGLGVTLLRVGAGTDDVIGVLRSEGAELQSVDVAEWQAQETVRERLSNYASRVYSMHWQVPDEVFPLAMEELRRWVKERYESEDELLSSPATFEITVARHWSSV